MPKPANLIIISGPSQVGKDAVVNQLLEKGAELNLVKAVTFTSREQRPEEKEGQDFRNEQVYYFCDNPEALGPILHFLRGGDHEGHVDKPGGIP